MNSNLTVLLADENPAQLFYISALVRRLRPEWRVVAEVASSTEVEHALEALSPSLAILDIGFSKATSLQFMEGFCKSCPVIFVASDPLLAEEAFACEALDFVLKPVKVDRLEHALRKGGIL